MKIIISLMLFVILFQGIKLNIPEIPFLSYIDEIFIVICLILALKRIIKSGTINKNSFKILLALMVFIILGILSCVLNSQFDIKSLMVSTFLSVKFWLLIFALENINLDDKVKEVAIYRLKYPDVSLTELSEIISMETGNKITKSGLHHRMHKIKEMASKVKNM